MAGTRFIYPGGIELRRLSWPRWLVTYQDGLPAHGHPSKYLDVKSSPAHTTHLTDCAFITRMLYKDVYLALGITTTRIVELAFCQALINEYCIVLYCTLFLARPYGTLFLLTSETKSAQLPSRRNWKLFISPGVWLHMTSFCVTIVMQLRSYSSGGALLNF